MRFVPAHLGYGSRNVAQSPIGSVPDDSGYASDKVALDVANLSLICGLLGPKPAVAALWFRKAVDRLSNLTSLDPRFGRKLTCPCRPS